MFPRKMVILVLVLVLIIGLVPASAQEGTVPQITAVTAISFPSSIGLRSFPAPDGHQIAFESAIRPNGHIDRYACVMDTLTPDVKPTCPDQPEDHPRGVDVASLSVFWPFSWSPDSQYVALVGQPLLTGQDTDLWILEASTGLWTRIIEDGYEGPLSATDESAGPPAGVTIDLQPAWSPDGSQIIVERATVIEDGMLSPTILTLIDVETHDVQELAVIPGDDPKSAVTGMAWSPDGTHVAVNLRHSELDETNDGLWQIDVTSGEMIQIASFTAIEEAFQTVFPDVEMNHLGPLSWSADGEFLMLWAGNLTTTPISLWMFWFDTETSALTPVPLPQHPNDTGARRVIWPQQAAWSAEGHNILLTTTGFLPDENNASLDPASPRARTSIRFASPDLAETVLLGGLPAVRTAVPLYLATWGPDGQALLNGYNISVRAQ